jgi:hypothetical protein
MAAQVQRPVKKSSGLSEALTIAGAVVGGIKGGPPGAAAGASLGQTAGGMIEPQQQQAALPEAASAAQRKLQPTVTTPQVQDPISVVQNAQVAAMNLPEQYQKIFAPVLATGLKALQSQKGTA